MSKKNKKIKYSIKVPVYVSEKIKETVDGTYAPITSESLIESAKFNINKYNSNHDYNVSLTATKRNKTTTIGVKKIDVEDIQFNEDKCILLKVTAYKTNLIDGYYQSANDKENKILFEINDKLCSDTYFFILYPSIFLDYETLNQSIYWHIFVYEDPTKDNKDMVSIARLIMKNIIMAPIRNIKSEKILEDLRKYDLIPQVEITLSVMQDNEEGNPEYLTDYVVKSTLKKEKHISLSDMKINDVVDAINDESFIKDFTKRQLKFIAHNKRTFSIIQEYKENLTSVYEYSFNYIVPVDEQDVQNGNIFKTEYIKRNIEGIFSAYMTNCTNE